MYDPRNGLTRDVSRQLIHYFGDQVFRTVVPRNVRLAEAPSHGLPILLYDRGSRGIARPTKRWRQKCANVTPNEPAPVTSKEHLHMTKKKLGKGLDALALAPDQGCVRYSS